MSTFRFNIWATTSSGPLTGSAKLDDTVFAGGGKEVNRVEMFSLFKGKKAPASSIKDLADASKKLTNLVSGGGKATEKRPPAGPKGVYKVTEDEFLNILPQAEAIIEDCKDHARRVAQDLPWYFDRIRDAYRDPATSAIPPKIEDLINDEESKIRTRFKEEKLIPTFGIEDVFKSHGVIGQSEHEVEITNAVTRSEMQTRMEMVSWAEELILEALEAIKKGVQRGRTQGDALLHAIEKCSQIVEEYSDNPDLVESLLATVKEARKIDTTAEGLKDEQAKLTAEQALAHFTNPATATVSTTQAGEWTEADEQAQAEHLADLDESYDANPSHDTDTGDVVVDTSRPITEIMAEKYGDDDDVF